MIFPTVSSLVLLCSAISISRNPVWAHSHGTLHKSSPRSSDPVLSPPDLTPDFSNDPFPPYPPLPADGNVTDQSWRYTRLFGWKGCGTNEKNIIKQAYSDFYKLAQQKSLYSNIDWNSQPAREFWGHATQANKQISSATKGEIKQIFSAAQQVYDRYFGINPFLLYIRVQCSPDGDESNSCGDKPTPDPNCPGQTIPPEPQENRLLEAYSNPEESYSKITFCNRFFNAMDDLDSVITHARRHSRTYQDDLWNYQNRARVFFHEITHLNYFMNAPASSPYVDDLKVDYRGAKGKRVTENGYGPENVKSIANYEAVGRGGWFPQRNADTYAWYAVAKYVEGKIGRYPYLPQITRVPSRAPRDGDGKQFNFALSLDDNADTTSIDNSTLNATSYSGDHYIPGCADHFVTTSAFWGVDSVANDSSTNCDQNSASNVPYNVFYDSTADPADAPNIYDKFCYNINSPDTFNVTVDAHGNPVSGSPVNFTLPHPPVTSDSSDPGRKTKRLATPDPNAYNGTQFTLVWQPTGNNSGCGQEEQSCRDGFAKLATSPCGHTGDQKDNLANTAQLTIPGCGSYSWSIASPSS